jgi:hypothetical protein
VFGCSRPGTAGLPNYSTVPNYQAKVYRTTPPQSLQKHHIKTQLLERQIIKRDNFGELPTGITICIVQESTAWSMPSFPMRKLQGFGSVCLETTPMCEADLIPFSPSMNPGQKYRGVFCPSSSPYTRLLPVFVFRKRHPFCLRL